MDARVLPDRPQDAVFYLVQGQFLALQGKQLQVPGAEVDDAALDLLDRVHRVTGDDNEHRQRVVQVDPVGHLFIPGIGAGVDDGEALQGTRTACRRSSLLALQRGVVERLMPEGSPVFR